MASKELLCGLEWLSVKPGSALNNEYIIVDITV